MRRGRSRRGCCIHKPGVRCVEYPTASCEGSNGDRFPSTTGRPEPTEGSSPTTRSPARAIPLGGLGYFARNATPIGDPVFVVTTRCGGGRPDSGETALDNDN